MEQDNLTSAESSTEIIDVDINSMEGYDKPVKRAKYILFGIGALQIISALMLTEIAQPTLGIVMGTTIFIGIIFIALGLWTDKKPYSAIVTALVIYTSLQLMNFVVNPASLLQGIFLKAIIYVLLFVSVSNARDVQRWKESIKKG